MIYEDDIGQYSIRTRTRKMRMEPPGDDFAKRASERRSAHAGRDSDWVSRKAYDILMEKLDAATLENQKLAADNRRLINDNRWLQKRMYGSFGEGGIRIRH